MLLLLFDVLIFMLFLCCNKKYDSYGFTNS